ncbi:MAG: hypothetical protein ACNA7J_04820 [Wenzhouxiangella sp.]
MMLKHFRLIVAAAAVLLATVALAEPERPPLEEMPHGFQVAFWLNQAALAYNEQHHRDWARATEKLHGLRPYNQDFMTHLVKAYARLGETSKAFNMMLFMQQQGLAEDWDQVKGVESLRQHRVYTHLNDLMAEAGKPFGQADPYTTLDVPMPEALAHDAETGRLFVGTVNEGRILYTVDGDEWHEFANPETNSDLMAVFDLAVDSKRGHLWVATGMVSHFSGYRAADQGLTGLLKLDLETGETLAVHQVIPDGHPRLLGSIVLADDGTVYAADTGVPMIFRLSPGERFPQPFFSHQNFSSLRGIALSGDGRLLYMVDYELGVLVMSLGDVQHAWKLAVPETLNEGGIDGIYWWDNHLVVIQNGISPQRVLRLELGPDGLGVVNVAAIAGALEEFDVPTFGTMVGDKLYFLGASHWQKVDQRGQPAQGELPPVPILHSDVSAPKSMVAGHELLDELRRQEQR